MRKTPLLFALLLVAGGLASGALASPQPTPVCGVCGGGLVVAADDSLDGLTVEKSVATVRVHRDGSATWHVTNRISNESALAYLEEHPEAADELAARALEYGTIDGPYENVSATVNGSTLRIRWTDADAARRMPGGVLVVEYFHTRGYDTWPVMTADRLSIVGPEGTTVTNGPPGADVDDRRATWTGNASTPVYDAPTVHEDAYVAFADGGLGATLFTTVDLALATAPIVVGVLGAVHLPPLLVLFLGLVGVVAAGRRLLDRPSLRSERAVALGVGALGALVVAVDLLGRAVPQFNAHRVVLELGVVYLAIGAMAYWRDDDARVRDVVAAGVLALVGIWVAVGLTLPGEYVTQSEAFNRGLRDAVRLSPVVATALLGAGVASGDRRESALGGLAVLVAFFAVELSMVWPTQRPFGLVVVFFVAGAVGAVVAGIPAFLLGGTIRGGYDESVEAAESTKL